MKNFTWIVTVGLVTLCVGDLREDIELSEKSRALAHIRRRRYVVFPEGSTLTVAVSLQIAACLSTATLSGGSIFTEGIAWALSYDLPNETIHTKDNKYDFPMIKRHKRDLFVRVKKLMDSAGLDGSNCILKTICETAQRVLPRQGILEEILRLLFTYPPEENSDFDSLAGKTYVDAHEAGRLDKNCNDLFPCPISLLELGLNFGKYSSAYV